MTAFFDTSALIALVDPLEPYHAWSLGEFTLSQTGGPVVISDIVYAELSAGFLDQPAVDAVISQFGLQRAFSDNAALFNAGQRYKLYRQTHNGIKTNVLADFFIGAAAKSLGVPLITANPKDFRSFFTGLIIIHPGGREVVP